MKVWDIFVRLSHWLVVLLVIFAWLSANFGDAEFKWHSLNGYALFVLVLSRVIWAVIGSTTARFSYFLKSPLQAIYYLRDLIGDKASDYISHNPAGGWMVVLLWLILLSQAITGMFSSDDILAEGPFAYTISAKLVSLMTGWHHLIFDVLMIFAVLHVIAVMYHQIIKQEKLIQAMFNGKKTNYATDNSQRALMFTPLYWVVLILCFLSFIFWMVLP